MDLKKTVKNIDNSMDNFNSKIINKNRQIYIKIDDFREEKLEVYIKDVFTKIDESKLVDTAEEKALITAMAAASAYASTYGLPACPEDVKVKIAKEVVKLLGNGNRAIQKQLDKKGKGYKKRHENM
jgi:hypothetical protein